MCGGTCLHTQSTTRIVNSSNACIDTRIDARIDSRIDTPIDICTDIRTDAQ